MLIALQAINFEVCEGPLSRFMLFDKLVPNLFHAEFEQLLHPAFQEDEWILILVGGVLGAMVGFGQSYVLGA